MFHKGMIERTTLRGQWYDLYRIIRKHGDWVDNADPLADRVRLKEYIQDNTEDGYVAVVTSGRDCDMSEYCHSSLVYNLHPMKFEQMEQDTYAWADGPCYVSLCRPSDRPEAYSRDLALEAYEDGHPHIVSSVRFESYD